MPSPCHAKQDQRELGEMAAEKGWQLSSSCTPGKMSAAPQPSGQPGSIRACVTCQDLTQKGLTTRSGTPRYKREWVFFKEWTPRRIIVVVCQGEGLHQAFQQTEVVFGHLSLAGNHGQLNFSTSRGDLWGDRGLSFSSSPCPSTADKLEPKRGKDGTALHRPCKGVTSTPQFRPPVLPLIGDKTLCPENEIRLKPDRLLGRVTAMLRNLSRDGQEPLLPRD